MDLGEPSSPATTSEVLEVFELFKPKASKTQLIRIGADTDGSYLVPDDLEGIAACFSPGVNRIKYFEDFLTDHYGIPCHMCDFTCDVEHAQDAAEAGDADVPSGSRTRWSSPSSGMIGSSPPQARRRSLIRWT